MLRYYDENNLLKPAALDPLTGYRMYSIKQIPRLNKIKALRDMGLKVSEIAEFIDLAELELTQFLTHKTQEIQEKLNQEALKLKKIEELQQLIQKGQQLDLAYEVSIKSIPSCTILGVRRKLENYFQEEQLWQELSTFIAAEKLDIPDSADTVTLFHDEAEYVETNIDVEVAIAVPSQSIQAVPSPFTLHQLPAVPEMASLMVYGPYENINGAYHGLTKWLAKHPDYEISGITRQYAHRGPWNEADSQNYLSEIQIPIKKSHA